MLDFGSFVSPRAVPQMKDTAEVLEALEWKPGMSDLLAIIGNKRGAESAISYSQIRYLGFPFSISETFQLRNVNSSIEDSLGRVAAIQELCVRHEKKLLIYISMAFGNPYGDHWNPEIVMIWIEKMIQMGIRYISLADTVGMAKPAEIKSLFLALIPAFPQARFGIHLHTTPDNWEEKLQAAFEGGCRQFDAAIKGFGGCPMAQDDLIGNLPTENLLSFLAKQHDKPKINKYIIREAGTMAMKIMG